MGIRATCMLVSLAAALATTLPSVDAAEARLAFADTFGQAAMHAEGELAGGDADRMRGYMDMAGNRDGNVSQEEADRFIGSYNSLIGQQVGQVLSKGNTTLDGKPVVSSEMGDLAMQGAAGPARGGPPIAFQLNMTFLFHPVNGTTHTLVMYGRATPAGTLQMTIHAPDGWTLAANVTAGVVASSEEGRSISLAMPTAGERLVFTFTADPKSSPAVGPLVHAALLVALIVARRGIGAPGARRVDSRGKA